MICDPQTRAAATDSALVEHLAVAVETAAGTPAPDRARVKEVARAVEYYLDEHGPADFVESECLLRLTSRALTAVGEGRAGRRMYLFGTGMVHPAEWEVRGNDTMWVLDLGRMTVHDSARLELLFFGGLRLVLDSIAHVWDPTAGAGVLGLRRVGAVAADLLGGQPGPRRTARLAREISGACRRRLARIGAARGWTASPEVMNLDLATA